MGNRLRCCNTWPCTLMEDNFDRADSTDLGPKWIQQSPATSEIKDGTLYQPVGAGTCRAVPGVNYPRRGVNMYASPVPTIIEGQVYRFVFEYCDEDNYVYVDFRADQMGMNGLAGTIYIGVRTGGTDTDKFWNGMPIDMTGDFFESVLGCGYEPQGNGLIWAEDSTPNDHGGDRLLDAPFSLEDIISGSCYGLKNGGDVDIYWDNFRLDATVSSDGEACHAMCMCPTMVKDGKTYLHGLDRTLLLTIREGENCSMMDGIEIDIIQIQNAGHPLWPGPIPLDGLSRQFEWRQGDATCDGGTYVNWTIKCVTIGGETMFVLAADPANLILEGSGYLWFLCIGDNDGEGGFDDFDCQPENVSTCNPFYAKYKLMSQRIGPVEPPYDAYAFCCDLLMPGESTSFFVEITEG